MLKRYLTYGLLLIAASLLVRMLMEDPAGTSGVFEQLKAVFRPVGLVYLGVFGNPVAGLVLAAVIMAVLAWMVGHFWMQLVLPARRMLDGLGAAVRAAGCEAADPAALPRVRAAMMASGTLADDWAAFETTLIRRTGPRGEALYSSVHPSTYFNLRSLHHQGIDLRAHLPVAGYFVGVGLMLTFMGLVAGLYFASRGMGTADLNEARGALIQLLNASTFKFATSIAGIAGSLVYAMVVRRGIQVVEDGLHTLVRALEFHMPLIPGEALMQDQINEIRRQIQGLQRLEAAMSDLAASVRAQPPPDGAVRP